MQPSVTAAGTVLATTATTTVTGLGFRPVGIYIAQCSRTALGADATSYMQEHGLAGATGAQACHLIRELDGISPSSVLKVTDTTHVMTDGGGLGTVVFDADGFHINWAAGVPNARLFYFAVGGDQANAQSGSFNLSQLAGDQVISGLGFQPSVLILIHRGSQAAANMTFGTGISDGTTSHAWALGELDGVTPINVTRSLDLSALVVGAQAGPDYRAALASIDADGFTLNVTNPPAAADVLVDYIAFGGIGASVGTFAQGAAGNQTVLTGNAPSGAITWPQALTAAAQGSRGSGRNGIGFIGAAAAQGCVAMAADDGGAVTNNARALQTGQVNYIVSGAGATLAICDTAVPTAAGFDLHWSSSDGVARLIPYLAFTS